MSLSELMLLVNSDITKPLNELIGSGGGSTVFEKLELLLEEAGQGNSPAMKSYFKTYTVSDSVSAVYVQPDSPGILKGVLFRKYNAKGGQILIVQIDGHTVTGRLSAEEEGNVKGEAVFLNPHGLNFQTGIGSELENSEKWACNIPFKSLKISASNGGDSGRLPELYVCYSLYE